MKNLQELRERYETSDYIFMSKGENRETAEAAMAEAGIDPPDIDGEDPRRLHRR